MVRSLELHISNFVLFNQHFPISPTPQTLVITILCSASMS